VEIKPWHRLVEVLPPLSNYEFEALKASIAERGVLQHILVLPDGRIIDGLHRWKIAPDAPYDIVNLDDNAAFLLGLAMNTARRQLSPDQTKEIRKRQKAIALRLRQTGMTQEKVARILGVAQQTIDLWEGASITNTSNTCSPPDLRIKVPKKERERIAQRVAAGGEKSMSQVREIAKKQLGLKVLGDNFELLPNALIVHGMPSTEEYDEAFRRLSLIESAQSWWWGDLANARERDYGSLKEIAERYGKDYKALSTCQWVASRYTHPNRLGTLGFKHHMIAAPLEDRLEWLKRAS